MSAERLREAAALMRERATTAPERSPWHATRSFDVVSLPVGERIGMTVARVFPAGGSHRQQAAAAHIASWHPAVALAVADLLDREAEAIESGNWRPCADPALALADAYLGPP